MTGARVSEDIDAVFSRRLLFGEDLQVSYRGADGRARILYLDRNYNDTLGLLHENAYKDSRPLALPGALLYGPLDRVLRHVRRERPIDGRPQSEIERRIRAAFARCDGDDAGEFGKHAGALGINRAFLVFDFGPFRVFGHIGGLFTETKSIRSENLVRKVLDPGSRPG